MRFEMMVLFISETPDNESEEVWEIIKERSIDTQNKIVSGIANHFSSFTVSADEVRHETPTHLSTGHPILLIHGVGIAPLPPQGDCDDTFMNLKDYLEDMGYDVWSFNYNTARWIEITAGNLERAISGILQQKLDANYQGNKKVTIISHSMGGLVTRAYIQNYGLRYAPFPPMTERIYYNNDIDIVIMTGTPNHGSVWGAINYAAAIEPHARQINNALRLSSVQMIPGSDFLDNLNDTNRTLRLLPTDIDYHLIP